MDKHLLHPLQIIIKTQSAQRRIRKLPIGRGGGRGSAPLKNTGLYGRVGVEGQTCSQADIPISAYQ